jgi:osmotically-inducible protein OsmY
MIQDTGQGGYATEMWRGETEAPGRRTKLLAKVWDELRREPGLDPSDLLVDVEGDAIVLEGTVPSYSGRMAALAAASRVSGLVELVDHISIRLPISRQ